MKNKQYLVIGVPYSDNLGDYAIFDAIRNKIIQKGGDVSGLDLAGRKGFCDKPDTTRNRLKNRLIAVHNPVVKWTVTVANALLTSIRHSRYYNDCITRSDYIFIGGGNIFSDNYGNFPIKLFFLWRLIVRQSKPYSIICVGVGDNWSWLARFIFTKIVNGARSVSVRDHRSQKLLASYVPGQDIDVVPDPAVSLSHPVRSRTCEDGPGFIGINVVDWPRIFFSSDLDCREYRIDYQQLYLNLLRYCQSCGYKIVFFTNGAREDNQYLAELSSKVYSEYPAYVSTSEFCYVEDYSELLSTIARCELIISSRLHSIIIASAFGIPATGLVWDGKVRAFYELLNHSCGAVDLAVLEVCDEQEWATYIMQRFIDPVALRAQVARLNAQFDSYISKLIHDATECCI